VTSNEWLPPPVPFEIVRRGFAPDQVTAHLEKLEYDLRIATANRDATTQRLAELGAQLAAAQTEADNLRAQLDRMALEPVSMASLSDRMQRLIRIAEEEAAETRAKADEYSSGLRERTDRETADRRAALEAEATTLITNLQAGQSELEAARAQFDAERDRTRSQLADQVRDLIAEATAEAEATRERARADAHAMTSSAIATAEATVSAARAEAERLDAESESRRLQAEEDFTLALNARRSESHQLITAQEAAAVADATARVEAATTHATAVVAAANDHATTTVARATAESHQRVAEADAAIGSLTGLRAQLISQLQALGTHLDQVRNLVTDATPMLEPPEQEAGRPVTDHFPPDPAGRPTQPPGFAGEAPVWSMPEQEPFVPPSALVPSDPAAPPEPVTDAPATDEAAADEAAPGEAAADERTPDEAADRKSPAAARGAGRR
jgi:hypothetical protein